MTIDQVVRKVLLEDHADVVRESVRSVAQALMEQEVTDFLGAEALGSCGRSSITCAPFERHAR